MRRLLHVISLTHDLERTKAFYRDAIGLAVTMENPAMASFSRDGAGFTLVAVPERQPLEIELCFESPEIEETMRALRQRGVEFIDELRQLEFGSVVHFRDPEGNLLSLLRPSAGTAPSLHAEPARATPSRVGDGLGQEPDTRPPLALVDPPNSTMRLESAVLSARDFVLLRGYYRDRLGLALSDDAPGWARFQTGGVALAMRPRMARGAEAEPAVVLVMETDDLNAWAEEARARGVEFESAPTDRGFGLEAETFDPDGNAVVVREPAAEETLEERLAEGFEDDDAPRRTAMRKPVKKVAHAASRVAIRPEYKVAKKRAVRRRPSATTQRPVSVRGAGPAGTRLKPKRTADPKRARTRPATGRLKKAEARSAAAKKRSVASRSRSKPVKRKAAKVARARRRAR